PALQDHSARAGCDILGFELELSDYLVGVLSNRFAVGSRGHLHDGAVRARGEDRLYPSPRRLGVARHYRYWLADQAHVRGLRCASGGAVDGLHSVLGPETLHRPS